jgi:hypothetical protein
VNGKVNPAFHELAFNCAGEQTLSPCANIWNRGFRIVPASLDYFGLAFQTRPPGFERLKDLLGLNDGKLTAASADNDFVPS